MKVGRFTRWVVCDDGGVIAVLECGAGDFGFGTRLGLAFL